MSQHVFVLGAGASREAGGPLMFDFLDIAEELQRTGRVAVGEFSAVFEAISALTVAHSKAALDLDNIESVFAAFEMAKLFGRSLGSLTVEHADKLANAIRHLIVRTLELRIKYPTERGQEKVHVRPPLPYGAFVELLHRLKVCQVSTAAITFNYDVALDYAFSHSAYLSACYFLDEKRSPASIPLLKLHGSLNWTRCKGCGCVVPWDLRNYTSRHQSFLFPGDAPDNVTLQIASDLAKFEHCKGQPVETEPVLVPPTWNKTSHHQEIAAVWKQAAEELSTAENIFVIGYSLPDSDQFFRILYALGTIGNARLKRFWVFDPDATGLVEQRFRQLLGQAALHRFRMFPYTFSEAVPFLRRELATPARA